MENGVALIVLHGRMAQEIQLTEDNLYRIRGQLSPGNAPMVERAARIIRELDPEVATPAQARDIRRIG